MELWIRSQNKLSLTKVNSVIIDYNDQKKIIANYIEFNGNDDYIPLGEYETEERALEVLNKISKLVENAMYHTQVSNEVIFYQMPEEKDNASSK